MRKIIEKGGAAHFEMIISFVFFVGFLFFLFMVLKPQDNTVLSNSIIAALYDSFEESVQTNLTTFILKIEGIEDNECYFVELSQAIFYYEMRVGGSLVVNLDGSSVDSTLEEGDMNAFNLGVQPTAESEKDGDGFFRVAISPEFSDVGNVGGCEDADDKYQFGGIVERDVVSYSALSDIAARYHSDYEGLRGDLKVPAVFDFAIVPETLLEVAMEPSFGIPTDVEVMAQDYIAEVLKSDGTTVNERFSIKIW